MSYTADQLRKLKAQGKAMPPTPAAADAGKPASYPINNAGDLQSAVGLARTFEQRAFCIRRAKALGLSSKIPDSWSSNG